MAYTLQVGRTPFEFRRIAVCQGTANALDVLESLDPQRVHTRHIGQGSSAPVIFMFSGVGDQYPNLAAELYAQEQPFRESVDHCCDFLKPILGLDLREVLFTQEKGPVTQRSDVFREMIGRSHASSTLSQTEIAQPAVFVIEYALNQLLQAWGIRPSALVGYSLGEYTAACVAGVFSVEDALSVVAGRAKLIQQLPEGHMLAVSASEEAVRPFLSADVCLAIVNGPATCVLAGAPKALAVVAERLSGKAISHRFLGTSHAFHSHLMHSITTSLSELVGREQLHPPRYLICPMSPESGSEMNRRPIHSIGRAICTDGAL